MKKFQVSIEGVDNPAELLAKRMFFLAWNACKGPLGMGWLQNRPEATEEDIFQNVASAGDYSGNFKSEGLYGDYVFGRMMKWGCEVKGNEITLHCRPFEPDYQAFEPIYKDDMALLDAAVKSLGAKVTEVL